MAATTATLSPVDASKIFILHSSVSQLHNISVDDGEERISVDGDVARLAMTMGLTVWEDSAGKEKGVGVGWG
ncbi:hypothetical protein Droror1_Dr00012487 [Drosera rotundifolia]